MSWFRKEYKYKKDKTGKLVPADITTAEYEYRLKEKEAKLVNKLHAAKSKERVRELKGKVRDKRRKQLGGYMDRMDNLVAGTQAKTSTGSGNSKRRKPSSPIDFDNVTGFKL